MNTDSILNAILRDPGPATKVGGWNRYRDGWRTNERPDGSATTRRDKMTLRATPTGVPYVQYNGASFQGGDLWEFCRRQHGINTNAELFGRLRDLYGIPDDPDTYGHTMRPFQSNKHILRKMNATPRTPTMPDENNVCTIPDVIVKKSFNWREPDQLRIYLETLFDPMVVEGAFVEYQVGRTKDGKPIFWTFDVQGRCRSGKVMRYTPDGHRDKKTAGSIIAADYMLKQSGHLPADWTALPCLFGEHLLTKHPECRIGLVESEKTAIVCAIAMPKFVFIATGGATHNLDRAAALLSGRKVAVFPDADAFAAWSDRFGNLPGWTVSDLCLKKAKECGPDWQKCDLADLLAEEATQARKARQNENKHTRI